MAFVFRLIAEGLDPEKAIDIARDRFGISVSEIWNKIKD